MKTFDGLNYYEILKIPVNSSFVGIKRAYRDALAIYEEDSMATYSLFNNDERKELLNVIEEAFYTLIDENKRAEYNRRLVEEGQVDASLITRKNRNEPTALFETQKTLNSDDLTEKVKLKSDDINVRNIVNRVLANEVITGRDLKKIREIYGIEIPEIYAVTKISKSILRMIEEDQFDNLPAEIYLRFFLKTYAEILQLDARPIVTGYLKNMSEKI